MKFEVRVSVQGEVTMQMEALTKAAAKKMVTSMPDLLQYLPSRVSPSSKIEDPKEPVIDIIDMEGSMEIVDMHKI